MCHALRSVILQFCRASTAPVLLLELLNSPRFVQRLAARSAEVQQRISELRNDWGNR